MPDMRSDICSNYWLKGNFSSEHEKNKSYKCPICRGIFEVHISLKGHISSEHEIDKSYKCPICDVIFAVNIDWKVIFLQNMRKLNLTNAQSVKWYLK